MLATPRRDIDVISFALDLARARPFAPPRARRGVSASSPRRSPGRRAGRICLRWVFLLGLALLAGPAASGARAEPPLPALGADGLSSGRYVASGLDRDQLSLRLAGSLGYGFTESVLSKRDRHQRGAGELAIALVVAPWLQATLSGELRVDHHSPDGDGRETGLLGSTRLATRHVLSLGPRMALGLAPRVHFPGAESPARGFRAASYELLALFSARLPRELELSLNAGYRLDRTRLAHEDARALPEPQRLAAGLTDAKNACLLGALLVAPLGPFRLSAEWSWELLLAARVRANESPMRVRVALQRLFGERFLPGVELSVDTSSRPDFVGLTRIEPRVWARLSLAVLLGPKPPHGPPPEPAAPAPPKATPEVAAEALHAITLRIVDVNGKPIAGARIMVPGEEARDAYRSDADGHVTLQVPAGITAVTIEAPGFEPVWRTLGRDAGPAAVVLKPELPPAEIKGVVRNLAGDPVAASVTVLPEKLSVLTDARGQFAIGVAPGDYTLKIEADGYEPQERRAQVELRGVTIVVIDLRRADR